MRQQSPSVIKVINQQLRFENWKPMHRTFRIAAMNNYQRLTPELTIIHHYSFAMINYNKPLYQPLHQL